MKIIPKAGKALVETYKDKGTKHIQLPNQAQKRRRWCKVVLMGEPLKKVPEKEAVKEGDEVCIFTGGIKNLEDDMAIIDQENFLLK